MGGPRLRDPESHALLVAAEMARKQMDDYRERWLPEKPQERWLPKKPQERPTFSCRNCGAPTLLFSCSYCGTKAP